MRTQFRIRSLPRCALKLTGHCSWTFMSTLKKKHLEQQVITCRSNEVVCPRGTCVRRIFCSCLRIAVQANLLIVHDWFCHRFSIRSKLQYGVSKYTIMS